ncbi:hypothetical protein [Hymenobacter negativus]|uniref:Uncharacterized protein n=1 Tax=Hymenobacter negativus TaxID=2795026 RepID=A0ABS0Q210_9BACT|nr:MULTISPECIES: hypothetical protein [Bacteria]MBH8556679.1 hypothetical protein [Hymenobacter negativus]MBH8571203.1 hypothetical protein [Hymenobacter negativus]MBR7210940.1 hypothetical protein [Microvirga sp. STS02]
MTTKTAFASLFLALLAGSAAAQQGPNSTVAVQDKTQPSPRLNPVQARADRLSEQMVRDLHLNNYQATKLRAVNADKIAKMAAIERKNAGNQKLIDEQCNGVCKERDQEFQAFLSNDQYTSYFGSRSVYNRTDRDFANQSASILLTNSVQNPSPARANDASIAPTSTRPTNRPAGNLGRNAR